MAEVDEIRVRFEKLLPFLDERMRRLVAATESLAIGFGGTSVVSRETGVSRRAIIQGIKELDQAPSAHTARVRRAGGGRKKTVDKGCDVEDRSGTIGGTSDSGRSGVSFALDVQECVQACGRTHRHGPSDQPSYGRRNVA